MTPERIARVVHEANRAYCTSIGDYSQLPWEEAPEWQRESALAGVKFVLAYPEAPPSANHVSWYEVKAKDGWRYGPLKDPVKKEHPCMVPFEDLPKEQQAKDVLFRAVVLALAP